MVSNFILGLPGIKRISIEHLSHGSKKNLSTLAGEKGYVKLDDPNQGQRFHFVEISGLFSARCQNSHVLNIFHDILRPDFLQFFHVFL